MKWIVFAAAILASGAQADIHPTPRPAPQDDVVSSRGATAIQTSTRPVERMMPQDRQAVTSTEASRTQVPRNDSGGTVQMSDRPRFRPDTLIPAASRTPRRSRDGGGGLCGRSSIQGTAIAPVTGPGACGIPDAVSVSRVSGVQLTRPARMDCDTATALDDWVRTGLLPTIGRTGGGAVGLQVAAGYACRSRNSQAGARVSEHAKGRAIDISAIQLANGSRITVLTDWNRGANGRMLRTLWRAACGPFGTVLGPDSDRYHLDHFHLDTADYRSGSYCR